MLYVKYKNQWQCCFVSHKTDIYLSLIHISVTSSKKASTPSKAEVISSNKAVTSSKTLDINRKQSRLPGLYLENGCIKLNGEKFYGIGTIYYDLATRQFYDPLAPTFEKGVKTVKSYGIPMIRVRLSAWGSEGMSLFWNDRETYWVVMDQAVRLCEQYEIGIIGTLAWTTNQMCIRDRLMCWHYLSTF